MNRIFDIALNDLSQILRDRMSFLFLLIMPIGFTLMFGFAFGGLGQAPADSRLALGFLDQDHTPLSAGLESQLNASSGLRLDETASLTADGLGEQVAKGELAVAVIVPAGYGAALQAGQPARVSLLTAPAGTAGLAARGYIQTAAERMLNAALTARLVVQATGAPIDSALSQALVAWQRPPVQVNPQTVSAAGTEKNSANLLSTRQTAPGMMLQFGLAGLISAAQVMVSERKSRCLQRLLTAPVRRSQILLGHSLAMFLMIFIQFLILITFGQLALGLDYLSQPLATLVMALTSALFLAGLGLLIGAAAKSDEQAIIFAMITMFVFSGLGGAWMPLENTSPVFQAIGHLTPVAWAMDGFKTILAGGANLLPAIALLGYAALFFLLAVWRFRFES